MQNLNKQQERAVKHTGKPLLIVAGAGTGKTTVITQKIGWLIEKELAKSDEILALTFTEKAAGEMQERVDQLLPYGYVDLWIMTFHGFAEKILQQHGLDIGLPTGFKLFNEFQQWALVKKNLDSPREISPQGFHRGKFNLDYYQPLGNPTKFISALLRHFSRAKDEDINPTSYLSYAGELRENVDNVLSGENLKRRGNNKFQITNNKQIPNSKSNLNEQVQNKEIAEQEIARVNEIANAYHVYQNLLLENNALDFGDLINYTLKLFRERPGILEKFRQQFKYILVDEFQDTNWAQYELIKLLAPQGKNLTVVGDDDQSIFRFRGASMSNILQFKKDFTEAEDIVLTQNYRSSQNILDTAYEFIQLNNPNRLEVQLSTGQKLDKRLISNIKEEGVIKVVQGKDLQDEVNKVVEKIAELKAKDKDCSPANPGGTSWNDFAILVRANNSAKEFVNALEIARLPYIFLASKGLYSRPVIMDVIAYLKLLDNYHESMSLYRVLNIPVFKFTHEEIIKLINLAKKKTWSLFETLRNAVHFDEAVSAKANIVMQLITKHAALINQKKVSEIIMAFLQDSNYLDYLSKLPEQKSKEVMRELNAFMKRTKEFAKDDAEASVKNFLMELDLEIESGEQGSLAVDPEEGPEMIKILTVHAAKGLEFKYVFIANMVDLRFPTTERKDLILLPDALIKEILTEGDIHLEEERRLFYVAMTRAKQELYFSWAPDYGGTRRKKPSRFLSELGITNKELGDATHDTIETQDFVSPTKVPLTNNAPVQALPKYYSFTQLQAYKNCPWQYRYAHVLKIPRTGKAVFSFGQTMHLTLQKFFELMIKQNNPQQTSLFASQEGDTPEFSSQEKDLLKLYEESWINDWYNDKQQKEEYKKKGREIIKEFYNKHKDDWPSVQSTEQGFWLRLGSRTIFGKIDRVDNYNGENSFSAKDSGEASVQIVDYKTGKPKQEGKITPDDKEQLLIYQMAAEEVLKKKVANLQFYYLNNNSEINFLGTNDEKLNLQEKLLDRIKEIETSIQTDNFSPKPGPLCKFCDFNGICEFRQI